MKLIVPGVPIAMQRPRVFICNGSPKVYNPQLAEKNHAKATIRKQYPQKLIGGQAIAVQLDFKMPIPKSYAKKIQNGDPHIKKPDLDNLVKFILDVLNEICFEDDAQISSIQARKTYSDFPMTVILLDHDFQDMHNSDISIP